jgi:hypothetical protein
MTVPGLLDRGDRRACLGLRSGSRPGLLPLGTERRDSKPGRENDLADSVRRALLDHLWDPAANAFHLNIADPFGNHARTPKSGRCLTAS